MFTVVLEHVCKIELNSVCLLMFGSMCFATVKLATALQPHTLSGLWLWNHYIRSFWCILCRWEMEAHQTLRIPVFGNPSQHLALWLLMFREHQAQQLYSNHYKMGGARLRHSETSTKPLATSTTNNNTNAYKALTGNTGRRGAPNKNTVKNLNIHLKFIF